eukprot:TRINITY_DN8076_c0_g1_i1.p1 TRINITY_DN8076_c0_g1~~TRINITY_DN8076_c0_g1_i1.p1  ORF type:complete len:954 (+),score=317.50 TRINITY_DN8076_c0_g1_i1:105-2864(+)
MKDVQYSDLRLVKYPLGVGGQGRVYKALVPGGVYAAKVLHDVKEADVKRHTEEIKRVKQVAENKRLRGRVLLPGRSWTGEVARGNRLVQLMEYCSLGSLKDVLLRLTVPYLCGAYGVHPPPPPAAPAPASSPPSMWNPSLPKFTLNDTARVAKAVLEALVVFRDARVIHNDIKPGNIMINGKGEIKVGDFGGAKKADTYSMNKSCGFGSYEYMAPERLRGGGHSYEADVYSLGKTIAHMALGQPLRATRRASEASGLYMKGLHEVATNARVDLPEELDAGCEDPAAGVRAFINACLEDAFDPPPDRACARLVTASDADDKYELLAAALRALCECQEVTAEPAKKRTGAARSFRAILVVEGEDDARSLAALLPKYLHGEEPAPKRLADVTSEALVSDAIGAPLIVVTLASFSALPRTHTDVTHVISLVAQPGEVQSAAGRLKERAGRGRVYVFICTPSEASEDSWRAAGHFDASLDDLAKGKLNAPQPRRPTAAHLLHHPFLKGRAKALEEPPDFLPCLQDRNVVENDSLDNLYDPAEEGSLLGGGTYGSVWRRRRKGPGGALYAVKVREALSPLPINEVIDAEQLVEMRLSFVEQEGQLLAVMGQDPQRCQYILHLVETVRTRDMEYLVTELADTDLFGYVAAKPAKKNGKVLGLKSAVARALAWQLITAIEYIHRIGIVHRDIKPENILVIAPPGGDPTLRLADFGSACIHCRPPDPSNSVTYSVKGDPKSFAPEVLQSAQLPTEQCWRTHIKLKKKTGVDMWAAGCVLYYMLVGKETPFERRCSVAAPKDLQEVLQLFSIAIQGLGKKSEWKKKDAERELVQQLLQFDTEKRPSAAEALAHRLFQEAPAKERAPAEKEGEAVESALPALNGDSPQRNGNGQVHYDPRSLQRMVCEHVKGEDRWGEEDLSSGMPPGYM